MRKKSTKPTPKKAITRNRDWKPQFIESLRVTGNIRLSCIAAGIDRWTAYDHRKKDEKFAEQWIVALEEACDTLEAAAWRRARDGVKREHSHFYQGALVGSDIITEYSDTLLIFLLKAHRPEKYRERFTVEYVSNKLMQEAADAGIDWRENPALAALIAAEQAIGIGPGDNQAVGQT